MRVNQALGLLKSHVWTYFDHTSIVLLCTSIEVEVGLRGVWLVLARHVGHTPLFLG